MSQTESTRPASVKESSPAIRADEARAEPAPTTPFQANLLRLREAQTTPSTPPSQPAGLPLRPYFAEYFQVVPLQPEKILLRSPQRALFLRGRSNFELVPLLARFANGERSLSEIFEILQKKSFPKFVLINLFNNLVRYEVLLDGRPAATPQQEADPYYHSQMLYFRQLAGREAGLEQQRLARSQVVVFGLGGLGSHLLTALAKAGVGHLIGVDQGDLAPEEVLTSAYPAQSGGQSKVELAAALVKSLNPRVNFTGLSLPIEADNLGTVLDRLGGAAFDSPTVVVAALDRARPAFYESLNRVCLERKLTWTLAQFEGLYGLVGPAMLPGVNACFHCYRLRTLSHSPQYEVQLAFEDTLDGPDAARFNTGQLAAFSPLMAHSLGLDVLRLLGQVVYPAELDRLLTFNFLSFKVEAHTVLPVPDCEVCGGQPLVAQAETEAEVVSYA